MQRNVILCDIFSRNLGNTDLSEKKNDTTYDRYSFDFFILLLLQYYLIAYMFLVGSIKRF